MIHVRRQSRRKDWITWSEAEIIEIFEDSYIAKALILPVGDREHSIAPIRIAIEYKDGTQYSYELLPCPTCGRS